MEKRTVPPLMKIVRAQGKYHWLQGQPDQEAIDAKL